MRLADSCQPAPATFFERAAFFSNAPLARPLSRAASRCAPLRLTLITASAGAHHAQRTCVCKRCANARHRVDCARCVDCACCVACACVASACVANGSLYAHRGFVRKRRELVFQMPVPPVCAYACERVCGSGCERVCARGWPGVPPPEGARWWPEKAISPLTPSRSNPDTLRSLFVNGAAKAIGLALKTRPICPPLCCSRSYCGLRSFCSRTASGRSGRLLARNAYRLRGATRSSMFRCRRLLYRIAFSFRALMKS